MGKSYDNFSNKYHCTEIDGRTGIPILPSQNCDDKNHCDDRHDCCKCCCPSCIIGPTGPQGPTGSTGPQGPTRATGPSFNSFANGVITTNKLDIPITGTIIYDAVNIVGTDLIYTPATGVFTINTTGVYVIGWKIAVTPNPGTVSIEIDLVSSLRGIIGGISITATNPIISGSNRIYAATAGETFRFVNNSSGPISIVLVGLTGPIGTVSIFRIV